MDTAERYRRFATMETCGHSPSYGLLTSRIADVPAPPDAAA
ncbi:hypothetical protein ACSDR0_03435 [Streptosporangium sp. G11]